MFAVTIVNVKTGAKMNVKNMIRSKNMTKKIKQAIMDSGWMNRTIICPECGQEITEYVDDYGIEGIYCEGCLGALYDVDGTNRIGWVR